MINNDDFFENIQIDIQNIPSVEESRFLPLEKSYFKILLFNNILVFLLILVAFVYFWYIDDKGDISPFFQWILLAFLFIFLANLFFLYKSFIHKAYAFRQRDISYKSGWLWRNQTTVPFNRVQHCEVSQGVFDRYFKLAKIKIFTAGGNASDVSIPGLKLEEANDLKAFILNKVKEDEEQ